MAKTSKKKDKERIAELESQLKEMKKRLDDSELEAAVWSKMVDIAEQKFSISIKKNAGGPPRGIVRRSKSSVKNR